jgi:hypothetical protein
MEAAIHVRPDEEAHKRYDALETTLEKVARDEPTTGGRRLEELCPGVVDQLRRWLDGIASKARRKRPRRTTRMNTQPTTN